MTFNQYVKYFLLIICINQAALGVNITPEEKEALIFYNKGVELMKSNQFEESLSEFDQAITRVKKFRKAYFAKSRALGYLRKFEDAINVCNEALEFNIKQPRILTQKAFCLYALERYQESLDTAELAVQYGKNDIPLAYIIRADANGALGHYKLAIEDYDKALELAKNPNHSFYAETYLNRFCPLYKLKRYKEALATCDKALEITDNPNKLPKVYSKKASALNALGRHEDALKNAKIALEIDKKDHLGISEKKLAESKLKL